MRTITLIQLSALTAFLLIRVILWYWFFAALRLATGIETGYAQILMIPRKWTFEYLADLIPSYGVTVRRYPNHFDNYGWSSHQIPIVSSAEALETGYCSSGFAIKLAIRYQLPSNG